MIGGNITAELQIKLSEGKNAIGEAVAEFETVNTLLGFVDYTAGEAKYQTYDAKIAETTHMFICDYTELDSRVKMTGENSRLIVNGGVYDIKLIDNPMNLNKHLEIYLKYTGGQ